MDGIINSDLPVWIFCTTKGTPLDVSNVEHAFTRVLRAVKLAEHFPPHGLRHTFASLLLQQGESRRTCSGSSATPAFS